MGTIRILCVISSIEWPNRAIAAFPFGSQTMLTNSQQILPACIQKDPSQIPRDHNWRAVV